MRRRLLIVAIFLDARTTRSPWLDYKHRVIEKPWGLSCRKNGRSGFG